MAGASALTFLIHAGPIRGKPKTDGPGARRNIWLSAWAENRNRHGRDSGQAVAHQRIARPTFSEGGGVFADGHCPDWPLPIIGVPTVNDHGLLWPGAVLAARPMQ